MSLSVRGTAGGLIQLLAGMWEMWKANTFAATAFSSYGGFWMGWALYGILKSVRPCICDMLRPGLTFHACHGPSDDAGIPLNCASCAANTYDSEAVRPAPLKQDEQPESLI